MLKRFKNVWNLKIEGDERGVLFMVLYNNNINKLDFCSFMMEVQVHEVKQHCY